MKRIIAFFATLALAVGLGIASATPSQAYVNRRVTVLCNLAGTYWNISELYHRDDNTGSVQAYGFRVYHGVGPGRISRVTVEWHNNNTGQMVYVGGWNGGGTTITDTGDTGLFLIPSWEAEQDVSFTISSPSSIGTQSQTCWIYTT